MLLGILLGLGSALFSSLAYLASRRFTVRHAELEKDQPNWRGPLRLMVCSHAMLGIMCGIAHLFLTPINQPSQPADWSWAITTTMLVSVLYLTGNTLLFFALRHTEASRVAPLLGMKVVLLALVTQFVMQRPLENQQWVAVALATAAAWVLGSSGGRLTLATMSLAIGACAGFVCSDLFIEQMVPAWLPSGLAKDQATGQQLVRASMTGMSLVYVWSGILALILFPIAKPWRKTHWRSAAPYAGSWMLAMICLFSCFALTNIILGNILQSTRGLMSILLGVLIVKLGHHHIESHVPLKVVIQRVIAAAMMIGAITLYVTAKG